MSIHTKSETFDQQNHSINLIFFSTDQFTSNSGCHHRFIPHPKCELWSKNIQAPKRRKSAHMAGAEIYQSCNGIVKGAPALEWQTLCW